jgi:superfamily I DNA/RNA helicase
VPMGHAVAFPQCERPRQALTAALPREVVISAGDLNAIQTKVEKVFRYWKQEVPSPKWGWPGVRLLEHLLAPRWELSSPLGLSLEGQDGEILRLSEQQFHVLNQLARCRRVVISGGAGTGKTVLALEEARRLAQEGFPTLLTCFNRPLADYLRQAARGIENLDVSNFHQLCLDYAQKAGMVLPSPQSPIETSKFFMEQLPEALLQALRKVEKRYRAIVVDEGQDFQDEYWIPLQCCLERPDDDILFIFHDENQQIYAPGANHPAGLVEFELVDNFRNTRQVFEAAQPYYRGLAVPCGPDGQSVERIELGSLDDLPRFLEEVLVRLIEERIAPHDIVVLTGISRERSRLGKLDHVGRVRLSHGDNYENGTILVETIRRFKGLDRRVVVLVELDEINPADAQTLRYIGFTRARTHLVVLESQPQVRP